MELGDPYLYPGEGASVQSVKFRLVIFKPFIGEILAGRILSSNKDGLKVSMDFFSDIFVPGSLLQEPSEYDPATGLWKWCYEGSDDFVLRIGEQVSFDHHACNIVFSRKILCSLQIRSSFEFGL